MEKNIELIRKNIDIHNAVWKNTCSTNCYAYALGLDVPEREIRYCAYQPGVLGGYPHSVDRKGQFTYIALIESIYEDMKKLGIEIREVAPTEIISDEEWKIALFVAFLSRYPRELCHDFHFLRQREDGTWYHKLGYYNSPTNKDYSGNIITNLEECKLGSKTFRKCFSLRLK